MVLASDKKISILIGGTFLIGIIIGLFFARVAEENQRNNNILFSTQSVDGEERDIIQKEVICPWREEIQAGTEVVFSNPLVERAHDVFAIIHGISSQNYPLRGPAGVRAEWKGQLIQYPLDNVTAGIEGKDGLCVYSSLGKDIALLRQDNMGSCTSVNTAMMVGFLCPIE